MDSERGGTTWCWRNTKLIGTDPVCWESTTHGLRRVQWGSHNHNTTQHNTGDVGTVHR